MRLSTLNVAAVLGLILAVATACQPADPVTTTPPKDPIAKVNYALVRDSTNGLTLDIDSRIDILLVVDDSDSMRSHQESMSKNINAFIEAFAKIKAIDFHIGYTYVHDYIRYRPDVVPATCGADTDAPGRVNWEAPGTLKTLVGPEAAKLDRRYLTRDDDFKTILTKNLDPNLNPVNIKALVNFNAKKPQLCPQGAENEESFTPILGSLENADINNGPNKGFRRPGAFFVAIIFSDAKDESVGRGLTPQEFIRRLSVDTQEQQLGKKRSRVFSVVISPGTWIGRNETATTCRPDPAFSDGPDPKRPGSLIWRDRQVAEGENPLVEAARLTEDDVNLNKDSQVLSICSTDYGTTLAKYGFQIQQDALADITKKLPRRPQIFKKDDPDYEKKHLQVWIGNVPLVEGKQWDYNPQDGGSIQVYAKMIDWNAVPNEKIQVTYIPVDDTLPTTKPVGR